MHLNDAIGKCAGLSYICYHHEQACAMAAEGYARVSGHPGRRVNVTAGPGGINALNGVFGAFTDSIPMLVISGQAKRETCFSTYDLPGLRQLGDQEVDIIPMARASRNTPCKCASRRPSATTWKAPDLTPWPAGPVLARYSGRRAGGYDRRGLRALRPGGRAAGSTPAAACAIAGSGSSGSARPAARHLWPAAVCVSPGRSTVFSEVAARLGIPVATAWSTTSSPHDRPLFCGRPGTVGDRAGNFAVQNADVSDPRLAPQHPAGQLQLETFRPRRIQDPGRHRSGRAAQADCCNRPADRGRC